MLILGIESSCDDTSAALLECSKSGCFVIRESTASQIAIHKKYGGVVPEIAGRMHAEKIMPLIEAVLKGKKPGAIAVASGPGLITGLIVGVEAARALSAAWKIPVIGVNHMAGHIHSVEILNSKSEILNKSKNQKIQYPALALIVSGGHTEIIKINAPGKYKLIGATRDDAAGECFDKVAKLLNLPYPGGPQISKLAEKGNPAAIRFPRPMLNYSAQGGPAWGWDFSFAGLKTSALYYFRDNPKVNKANFCASFEQAIVDTLVGKMTRAIKQFKPKTVILCGGVSANKKLRTELKSEINKVANCSLFIVPSLSYCMDNAAMIAVAGYELAKNKKFTPWRKLKADPNWELGRPR